MRAARRFCGVELGYDERLLRVLERLVYSLSGLRRCRGGRQD
ncbi:hypothetical protein Daudx_0161 [Candidatus Desulforudis audaxviator]|nr:hypothetical protein Daudx_0161 [Candidatus Desulforudis audaxviator]